MENQIKIKRSTSRSNCIRGMKILNIYNFEKAPKVSWIKKLITQPHSECYKLLVAMYGNIDLILIFGDKWYSKILPKTHYQYGYNVLKDRNTLIKIQKAKNN